MVKRLREARGLTQGQLATYATQMAQGKTVITRPWLSLVESGERERPDPDRLRAIADVLRVAPETLLAAAGYRVTALPERQQSTEELLRAALARVQQEGQRILILPEVSSPAHTGSGSLGDAQTWTYVPAESQLGHRFLVVPVVGDCMTPRLLPGHRVVVDKDASPRPGNIVVAEHEGEWVIKELAEHDGERWLVCNKGEPLKVNGGTRIEGVVVEAKYRP
ncbi:MAG: S24 family peptidase [Chloroflexota bacterium]